MRSILKRSAATLLAAAIAGVSIAPALAVPAAGVPGISSSTETGSAHPSFRRHFYRGQAYHGGWIDPAQTDDTAAYGAAASDDDDALEAAVAYCADRFKSYDPSTGTYMGYDGYAHPCPDG